MCPAKTKKGPKSELSNLWADKDSSIPPRIIKKPARGVSQTPEKGEYDKRMKYRLFKERIP